MKKFMYEIMQIKIGACISFTATILVYMVVTFCLGLREISYLTIVSLLVCCLIASLVQYFAFTQIVFKKLTYTLRLLVFFAIFFPVLIVLANVFDWVPTGVQNGSWIVFLLIFFVAFIFFVIGFEIYFRIAGKKYDGILGQYKKQNEAKK